MRVDLLYDLEELLGFAHAQAASLSKPLLERVLKVFLCDRTRIAKAEAHIDAADGAVVVDLPAFRAHLGVEVGGLFGQFVRRLAGQVEFLGSVLEGALEILRIVHHRSALPLLSLGELAFELGRAYPRHRGVRLAESLRRGAQHHRRVAKLAATP